MAGWYCIGKPTVQMYGYSMHNLPKGSMLCSMHLFLHDRLAGQATTRSWSRRSSAKVAEHQSDETTRSQSLLRSPNSAMLDIRIGKYPANLRRVDDRVVGKVSSSWEGIQMERKTIRPSVSQAALLHPCLLGFWWLSPA